MFRYFLAFLVSVLFTLQCNAQQAIGQWRVHLPFNQAKSLCETPERIFVAANDAVFYYNKNDNSVQSISKVNGLSDIGVNVIKYNAPTNTVVVGYDNGNIDLFKGLDIINIGDIKRKNITGGKAINHIYFIGKLAYLSCSFGIVVLDLERNEIKDTYTPGSTGNSVQVFATASDATYLYAGTDNGVWRAALNDPFIYNPANWEMILSQPINTGPYTHLAAIGNNLIINHNINANEDSVYVYNGNTFSLFQLDAYVINNSFSVDNGLFVATNTYSINVFDANLNKIQKIDNYNGKPALPFDAISGSNNTLLIADGYYGLEIIKNGNYTSIYPNGPLGAKGANIQIDNSQLWIGHAIRNNNWLPINALEGFSTFLNNEWKTYNGKTVQGASFSLDTIADLVVTAIHPDNSNHVYLGSWGHGLLEYNNGTYTLYNPSNSPLQNLSGVPGYYSVRIGGLAFDQQNNLWLTNTYIDSCLIVKKADGSWKRFNPPYCDASNIVADVMVDSYNQKWFNVYRKGLLVMNDNGSIDNPFDDQYRFINDQPNSGSLPSASVYCMAEDKDGQIWLGTEKGVAVIYSPGAVFSSTGAQAQQILINYGGYNEYLLDKEIVTAIAVDGANRKWFGTQGSGVYLMSADGTNLIHNFNVTNSPLQSNNIYSIGIDDKTGEVFFATERGIISYQGDAIEGEGGCNNVYTYPNPVRPGYSGPIAIKGVVPNGNIKISDISGNVVYETTALGSQAIWNGTDFNGNRVHSGVYLVYSSDADGTNTCITKILFMH